MKSYQEIYPSEPILRSSDRVRPSAAGLLSLEYFEAEPDTMPVEKFSQHHVLINLNEGKQRVEHWRGDEHRDFDFQKDEIVVTPAGMPSGWKWHTRSKCIVITLDPVKLQTFAESELALLLSDQQFSDLPPFKDTDITMSATMLLDALRLEGAVSSVVFEGLARVFLAKIVQKCGELRSEDVAFSPSFTPQHYKRVLDFLSNNYGSPIRVSDLAEQSGLSESHFSREFKKVVGESPYQFLMRYRVERAEELIAAGQESLFDIALNCGFADQPHLTRIFKQYRGLTPKKWRSAQLRREA